eukprot:495045_1
MSQFKQGEESIHIISIITVSILLFLSFFELCISSINDQPRIKYRFITTLFCFVELLITWMAFIYFILEESNHKWKDSIALLMRLCSVISHILGIVSCFHLFFSIIESFQHVTTQKWFKLSAKILCFIIIFVDILLTLLSIIANSSFAQNLFMLLFNLFMLLFCLPLFIALFEEGRHIRMLLLRTQDAFRTSATDTEQLPHAQTLSLVFSLSVHLLDVTDDDESLRTTYVNQHEYMALRYQMRRIYWLVLLDTLATVALIIGLCFYGKMMKHSTPMTVSPMYDIDQYLLCTLMGVLYSMTLLYWLYIPGSLCCNNIAFDSLFRVLCTCDDIDSTQVQNGCHMRVPSLSESENDLGGYELSPILNTFSPKWKHYRHLTSLSTYKAPLFELDTIKDL